MTPREPEQQKIFDLHDRESISFLTDLITRFLMSIFIKICNYIPDDFVIDDMNQSVWLRLLNAIQKGNLSDKSRIKNYTFIICLNIVNDYIREEISLKGASSKQRLTRKESHILLKTGVNPESAISMSYIRTSTPVVGPEIDSIPDCDILPGEKSGSEVSLQISEAVREGIASLSPAKKKIAMMFILHKKTEKQIADELGKAQSTISGHVGDIRRHLRSYLKKNYPEIVDHVIKGD